MTDELMIQQPIQQERPSKAPYVLGGAVAGGGAAYLVNKYVGKYKSADDIVKEMNNADTFAANTKEGAANATEWKDVKAAADVVKEKEKALENAKLAKLPDTAKEAKELQAAKDALNKEIERLQAIENSKVGTHTVITGGGGFPKADKIPNIETVKNANPASLNAIWAEGKKAGKSMTGSELNQLYNRLKNNIKTQEGKLERIVSPLETQKNNRIIELKDLATGYKNLTDKITDEQLGEFFVKEHRNSKTWVTELTPQYKFAREEAMKYLGNPSEINISTIKTNPNFKEGLLSISHPKEKGEKIDQNHSTARIKNAEGKWQEVVFNKDDALRLVKEEQQKLENRIESCADEIFEKMRTSVELQRASSPQALKEEFEMIENNVVKDTIAAKTGYYDSTKGKLNVKKLMNDKDVTLKNVQDQKNTFKSSLDLLKNLPKDQIVNDSTLAVLDLPSQTTASEAEEILKARVKTMKAFETRITDISKEANAMFEEISSVQELTEKIAEKKANFEPLTKAQEAFVKQFGDVEVEIEENGKPKKIKISEAATATSTTVEGTAKKITEADVQESFRQAVADKQKLYDEAAKKSGTVDENAVKAAETAKADAEKAFKDKTEALAKKLGKKPFMNKWAAIGIGAAALGLAGLMVAPKGNKEAV